MLSSSSNGIYVINRSGRTLYTASGQPLYHKEVYVKFPSGGKIYMMKTNGTMGYEYLNSTDSFIPLSLAYLLTFLINFKFIIWYS